jgi:endonuclease-3 related protein
MIQISTELLKLLKDKGYDKPTRDSWWWPNSGTFEVLVGAILTQNTKWENVEKSLNNFKKFNLLNIENIANISLEELQELIRPSGFYKAKSKNIKQISQNIINDFGTFREFKELATREWLLLQKGVGQETADSILNYACYKEAFVVDSYTNRLLSAFGYEFEKYEELQEWIVDSFYQDYLEVFPNLSRAQAYARAHGMIVEYCKVNKKGKVVDISNLLP